MELNKFAMLGFLGLFGLIGMPTQNYGLFGFFGFFGFFALLGLKSEKDRKTSEKNLGKAATNAFIVSSVGLVLTMVLLTTQNNMEWVAIAIATTFVAQFLTFTFSIAVFEDKEKKKK